MANTDLAGRENISRRVTDLNPVIAFALKAMMHVKQVRFGMGFVHAAIMSDPNAPARYHRLPR